MKSIETILITGGAGFVGSFTIDLLIKKGYKVTILDNLEKQVHNKMIPNYLNKDAKFIEGDIRDKIGLKKLIQNVDAIIHLAAMVGVGQSMYNFEKFIDVNTKGTATLLDVLLKQENNVKKLIIASSMSLYGEGAYKCELCCQVHYPPIRNEKQLEKKIWELLCPTCDHLLKVIPTDENTPLMPTSVYAMTKRHQEELCLIFGKTYDFPTVAMRYFNIYGPRQAINNPYTGVCSIFSNRILNNLGPYLFEDGCQTRDFIHVKDVAEANVLALEKKYADNQIFNIGSGKNTSIHFLSESLIKLHGIALTPIISQEYRKGDIRHCIADISKAKEKLGFEPKYNITDGLKEYVEWTKKLNNVSDTFNNALQELKKMKLTE